MEVSLAALATPTMTSSSPTLRPRSRGRRRSRLRRPPGLLDSGGDANEAIITSGFVGLVPVAAFASISSEMPRERWWPDEPYCRFPAERIETVVTQTSSARVNGLVIDVGTCAVASTRSMDVPGASSENELDDVAKR